MCIPLQPVIHNHNFVWSSNRCFEWTFHKFTTDRWDKVHPSSLKAVQVHSECPCLDPRKDQVPPELDHFHLCHRVHGPQASLLRLLDDVLLDLVKQRLKAKAAAAETSSGAMNKPYDEEPAPGQGQSGQCEYQLLFLLSLEFLLLCWSSTVVYVNGGREEDLTRRQSLPLHSWLMTCWALLIIFRTQK